MDKDILVVPRNGLGLVGLEERREEDVYTEINNTGVAKDRAQAELDQTFWQISPYITVIAHNMYSEKMILAYERLSGGNEKRLHGKIALGFGGHVKWNNDLTPEAMIQQNIVDELDEELGLTDYQYSQLTFQGYLQYDLNAFPDPNEPDKDLFVDRVHKALWYTYQVFNQDDADQLDTRETDKIRPFWIPVKQLHLIEDRMENWARIVASGLRNGIH